MKKRICVLLLLGLCLVSVSACGDKLVSDSISNVQDSFQAEETSKSRDTEETSKSRDTEETKENTVDTQTSNKEKSNDEAASEDAENSEVNENEELVDGMRPEFKDAMDSYEAFYDKYCDIVKSYTENPSDLKLLADYTDILAKEADMIEKFEAWEDSDLNNAELAYYLDVNNRVAKKILEVAD